MSRESGLTSQEDSTFHRVHNVTIINRIKLEDATSRSDFTGRQLFTPGGSVSSRWKLLNEWTNEIKAKERRDGERN